MEKTAPGALVVVQLCVSDDQNDEDAQKKLLYN